MSETTDNLRRAFTLNLLGEHGEYLGSYSAKYIADLVEAADRLRAPVTSGEVRECVQCLRGSPDDFPAALEASDLIERLAKENEQLRGEEDHEHAAPRRVADTTKEIIRLRTDNARLARENAGIQTRATRNNDAWVDTHVAALDKLNEVRAKLAKANEDSERIDYIEACIRDGSYASILNDIVAVCEHAYKTIGPGPAIRTTIDAVRGEGQG